MKKVHSARVFKYLFLTLFAFISAFPFYWMLVSATNATTDVIVGKMSPGSEFANNFSRLWELGLTTPFINSLRNTIITTLLSLLISSLAGYGFVIFKDKHKNRVMAILLLSMMVPAAATLIPLYRMFSNLKLVSTLTGFMLPSLATAFLIFMFRQATQSFPQEIVQAARIDGLGELGIFFKIFVPVMKPSYAAAATVTFMGLWNSYLWPLVILQSPSQITMPIFTANLTGGYVLDYGVIMTAVSLTTLPTLILFFALQKSFVEGILGSVK